MGRRRATSGFTPLQDGRHLTEISEGYQGANPKKYQSNLGGNAYSAGRMRDGRLVERRPREGPRKVSEGGMKRHARDRSGKEEDRRTPTCWRAPAVVFIFCVEVRFDAIQFDAGRPAGFTGRASGAVRADAGFARSAAAGRVRIQRGQ